ncbi:related to hydrolases or acyltransferases (alpha/beta hydrolase superfamily) [Cephalotrichum gorgonifer]|uniref:Related to hydrolases or acyltransferases (Alpha/beta hydrolase superfamily) n=1 Tax=Cephalotrichum gorgonifer TaxID=2041049 RepID=A0AAE8MWX8_9PEZI|nr:related to hydrolases or acyltransferases (alpha/beta hydrolase superfamily) [Cephalotrichum gorgonifer]
MVTTRLITQCTLASAAMAKPLYERHPPINARSPAIQWGGCDFEGPLPVQCGTLGVPLDYTDPSANQTLDLSLSKVAAVNEPFKGSILFNFGGPGYPAVESLAALGELLHNMTGGHHDLIAFDPRGTGKTIPFSCFDTPEERELATAKYPLSVADATDVALGDGWANGAVIANICGEKRKDIGGLVGTAFVARDIMQIVDALGEDGLLRFWGMSYGSTLGATVAAMFPDRMDRVILDGVVNSHSYFQDPGLDVDQFLGADRSWTAYLEECIKAGDKCPLSHLASTAEELDETLFKVLEEYRQNPVAIGDTVLTYSLLLTLYYVNIKSVGAPAAGAEIINNVVTRDNLTAVAEYIDVTTKGIEIGSEATFGIKCSDTVGREPDRQSAMPHIEQLLESSSKFGAILPSNAVVCAQWPFEAKERYSGDFEVKTPNPVLFLANTYDPATSIESARLMSSSFEGSVVVEQKGFGHGSISQPSACTFKAIRDYFANGVIPDNDIECEVDTPLFA